MILSPLIRLSGHSRSQETKWSSASHLLVTLKHLLKRAGSEYSPAKALQRLSELYSVDIVRPTIEGREIWLRRISKLDEEQQKILYQLQLQLPERLEPIQILKCSENSAIA
jgi:coenzyme F420-reducing hydrogenase beta subunit